jgi:hypothetical protein
MFNTNKKIGALNKLGKLFQQIANYNELEGKNEYFGSIITQAKIKNPWFTFKSIKFCFSQWSEALTDTNLDEWISNYKIAEIKKPKKVAIIMAGNIPMVGFHDLLCTIISGNHALIKLSSSDEILIKFACEELVKIEPLFSDFISFSKEKLKGYDAVIATGSDNSSRYFESYFGNYPNIIRKNRTSLALITNDTTDEEFSELANDIFTYYGLGCRNVTHALVPRGFDLNKIFKGLYKHSDIIQHNKYANNYDYHKAIFLMNQDDILENGFFMLMESNELFAPVSTLFYSYYENDDELNSFIENNIDNIQTIVGKETKFGEAQKPKLNDYADGVDTMDFLTSL